MAAEATAAPLCGGIAYAHVSQSLYTSYHYLRIHTNMKCDLKIRMLSGFGAKLACCRNIFNVKQYTIDLLRHSIDTQRGVSVFAFVFDTFRLLRFEKKINCFCSAKIVKNTCISYQQLVFGRKRDSNLFLLGFLKLEIEVWVHFSGGGEEFPGVENFSQSTFAQLDFE